MNTVRQNKNIVALNTLFTEDNFNEYIIFHNYNHMVYNILGFASKNNKKIDPFFTTALTNSMADIEQFCYAQPSHKKLYGQDAIAAAFGSTFYATFYNNYLYPNPTFTESKKILSQWANQISNQYLTDQITKSIKNTSDWQRKNIKKLFEMFTECSWLSYLKHIENHDTNKFYNQSDWKHNILGFAAFYEIGELDYQINTFCPLFKSDIGYQAIIIVFGEQFKKVFANSDNLYPINDFSLARAALTLWYHAILQHESLHKEQTFKDNKTILNTFVSNAAKISKKKAVSTAKPSHYSEIVDADDILAKLKSRATQPDACESILQIMKPINMKNNTSDHVDCPCCNYPHCGHEHDVDKTIDIPIPKQDKKVTPESLAININDVRMQHGHVLIYRDANHNLQGDYEDINSFIKQGASNKKNVIVTFKGYPNDIVNGFFNDYYNAGHNVFINMNKSALIFLNI